MQFPELEITMNTKTTISAIVMFAAVLGMVSFGPAFAAKESKQLICHFEPEYIEYDTNGDGVVDEFDDPEGVVVPAEWKVINVNGNALSAHVGVHTDGVDYDDLVDDSEGTLDDGDITTDACLARNPA